MYQKCPICNGTGKQPNILSSSSYTTCRVCKGAGIISELNGLPPTYINLDSDKMILNELKNKVNLTNPE